MSAELLREAAEALSGRGCWIFHGKGDPINLGPSIRRWLEQESRLTNYDGEEIDPSKDGTRASALVVARLIVGERVTS